MSVKPRFGAEPTAPYAERPMRQSRRFRKTMTNPPKSDPRALSRRTPSPGESPCGVHRDPFW